MSQSRNTESAKRFKVLVHAASSQKYLIFLDLRMKINLPLRGALGALSR